MYILGKRLLRFLLTMFPAAEKTLSEGTEVEGTHKYFLAMEETFGSLFIYHPPFQRLPFGFNGGSSK